MKQLENGFYTALGTPLDESGNLVETSLRKHINQQIDAGAAGLLLMGSMGIEASIKQSAYKDIARVGIDQVAGRVPLFIGAMDNSIVRVTEKIEMIGNADVDGIVLTCPYYTTANDDIAIYWYKEIADQSPYPIYIYDLAVVTKYKITYNVIEQLIHHPNIKGIKTADWELIKEIERKYPDVEFNCLCSRLDSFDLANMMGIGKNLDGMFSCAPKNGKLMAECFKNKDYAGGRAYLDKILLLRDAMASSFLTRCFTHCMNLLGCEGNFHDDSEPPISEAVKTKLEKIMKEIGEI